MIQSLIRKSKINFFLQKFHQQLLINQRNEFFLITTNIHFLMRIETHIMRIFSAMLILSRVSPRPIHHFDRRANKASKRSMSIDRGIDGGGINSDTRACVHASRCIAHLHSRGFKPPAARGRLVALAVIMSLQLIEPDCERSRLSSARGCSPSATCYRAAYRRVFGNWKERRKGTQDTLHNRANFSMRLNPRSLLLFYPALSKQIRSLERENYLAGNSLPAS